MCTLRQVADDYLHVRRALGYKMDHAARLLPRFVAYLETLGAETVTIETALAWAQSSGHDPSAAIGTQFTCTPLGGSRQACPRGHFISRPTKTKGPVPRTFAVSPQFLPGLSQFQQNTIRHPPPIPASTLTTSRASSDRGWRSSKAARSLAGPLSSRARVSGSAQA